MNLYCEWCEKVFEPTEIAASRFISTGQRGNGDIIVINRLAHCLIPESKRSNGKTEVADSAEEQKAL